MMKRMEELEAFEAASKSRNESMVEMEDSVLACASLKKQGNRAFASSNYNEAIELYTQAISLEANSHVS